MCTCLFGLTAAFCESCTQPSTVFQWKSEHLLVQNKVQVKSTVAGRPCSPAVLDLSCAAGHQDHHHDAHFHTEQDLSAAALGHHSACRWKHQLDGSEGSVQMLSRQRWSSRFASHSWLVLSAMPCRAISKALWISQTSHSRRCMWTEEEWSWWVFLSLQHTKLLSCHIYRIGQKKQNFFVQLWTFFLWLFRNIFVLWKTFYLSNFCFTSLFAGAT